MCFNFFSVAFILFMFESNQIFEFTKVFSNAGIVKAGITVSGHSVLHNSIGIIETLIFCCNSPTH